MNADVTWSEVLIARFTELHAAEAGHSYQRMAETLSREFRLSITKNSCIGKARRLGFELRRKPNKAHKVRTSPRPRMRFKVVEAPLAPVLPVRCDGPLTIYQLGRNDCRYPLGNFPYLYCGQAQEEGKSYCPDHYRLTHTVPRKVWA